MNSGNQRKIKVLLAVCNNVLNGTERYAVDLASHLPKDKFDVYIATPMKGPLSEILKENSINEVIFDNDKLQTYSLKGLLNMRRILKKERFDILHANAGILPCIMGRVAGTKFIMEVKHGIFYSKAQLDSLPFLRKLYEKSKKLFVDKFIATSPNDKKLMIDYFNIPEEKIDVIYLGLDIDKLKKKLTAPAEKSNNKEFLFGHIGRLTFQKAQIILLKAFRIISAKYPNARLVIVGDGEDKSELVNYMKENNLEDKIYFKGYISDIYNEMSTFDVHVLTSRFEGMGYVNLEAMALGVPVITSDVGGATNFLKDRYNALITRVEDPQSTADAMEAIISDTDLRNTLIENGRKTVLDFSVERMAQETANFYLKNIGKAH